MFFVIGTAFSSDVIKQINSSAAKQDEDIKVIVGQSLIETKEDLVKKLKSIMKVTKELAKFIDTSIHKYLPIRRRVFTRACSNILLYNKNTAESFKEAFDNSFSKAKDKIAKHFPELLARNRYQDNVAKTLLKYLSMFDVSEFDHTYLGALLPQHLENFTKILIASGIAPYYTDPQVINVGLQNAYNPSNVHFLFKEPLCMEIAKEYCKDVPITIEFWQKIFGSLIPKKDKDENARFDKAFIVVLTYLSNENIKICDLPFCKMMNEKSLVGRTNNYQKQLQPTDDFLALDESGGPRI